MGARTWLLDRLTLGMWQANCYILGDRELGAAVVVDPGEEGAEPIRERLAAWSLRCEAVLLTHGHLDHLWSAPELARSLDVPVFLHAEDHYLWRDPLQAFGFGAAGLAQQLMLEWDAPEDVLETVVDGQRLTFAGMTFTVRHTPGHTPGSSVFLLQTPDEPLLLSGDLLFAGSVGRTDFPGGSMQQQNASLRRVVLPLPDATPVLPGHGPETTVGTERVTNPFLAALV